jgi:hypothetical protein
MSQNDFRFPFTDGKGRKIIVEIEDDGSSGAVAYHAGERIGFISVYESDRRAFDGR